MSPEQLTLQTQLIVDAYATCLKELEEANRSGGVLLTFPDGDYVCFFACLSINEDLAGKKRGRLHKFLPLYSVLHKPG